jgi:hypothetical protein
MATGGGKTLVEYNILRNGFNEGFKIQVIVAPTIALLSQHHVSFENWSMFHPNGDAGQKLVEFFSSSLVKFIVNQMKLPSTQRLPTQLFRRIPKAITSKPWQEVFGFTDDELAIIEGKSPVSIKKAAE